MDFAFQSSGFSELNDESCDKCGNLVPVEHVELAMVVQIVVYQPVSISIKTASPLSGFQDRSQGRRQFLLCLHEVGTTSVVQGSERVDRGVD